jgi:hypothetical protein
MAPRQGHMDAMQRVFGYLKFHPKFRIDYDTELPTHAEYAGKWYEWFEAQVTIGPWIDNGFYYHTISSF